MTDTPTPPAPAPAPAKKRSWGRFILRSFLVLLLLIVIAVGILFFSADSLVRAGVVRGGEYATDQKTALELAKLSFFGGSLDLSKLDIQNLQDSAKSYKEPNILTMQACNVVVDPGSLLTNTIVVKSIDIRGLEVTLEQNGMKNNLSDLMEIIKKKTPAAATPASQQASTQPDAPGRQLKIEKLRMTGTKVHLRGMLKMDLDLGPIALDDPTNPDGRPMKIADLMSKILIHVAQQIVNNPQIPADFKNGMKNVSALVDSMGKDLQKGLNDATKGLQDAGKNLQDASKGLQDAGKNLQDAGKGLQNLLGGNKPPATKP
jgi:hypothetical protein